MVAASAVVRSGVSNLPKPGAAARVGVWVSCVEALDQDDVESGAPGLVAAKLAFCYTQPQTSHLE